MDIQEKKAFDAYFKDKYPELYKDVFDEDGDDRAIIGYSFALSAWMEKAKAQAVPEGFVLVPKEPTQAMLDSARDWSIKKYGKAVGNDGSSGCYKAMIEAQEPPQP